MICCQQNSVLQFWYLDPSHQLMYKKGTRNIIIRYDLISFALSINIPLWSYCRILRYLQKPLHTKHTATFKADDSPIVFTTSSNPLAFSAYAINFGNCVVKIYIPVFLHHPKWHDTIRILSTDLSYSLSK